MKKLSLKSLNLTTGDLLDREQLKTVSGGYGCTAGTCINDSDCDAGVGQSACRCIENSCG